MTYSCGDKLYVRMISLDLSTSGTVCTIHDEPVIVANAFTPVHVPQRAVWYKSPYGPLLEASLRTDLVLAVALQTEIHVLVINIDFDNHISTKYLQRTTVELPDQIIGFLVSEDERSGLLVHTATDNGRMARIEYNPDSPNKDVPAKFETYALDDGIDDDVDMELDADLDSDRYDQTDWIDQVRAKADSFTKMHNIHRTTCKVYGMTLSPCGGTIAISYR